LSKINEKQPDIMMDDKTLSGAEWIQLGNQYLMETYSRFPFVPVRGEGMILYDCDGGACLDFLGGIAVCGLGHSHPEVTAAIREQAATLAHVSNLYHIPLQIEVARLLVENSFAQKVFFCNSGAEANEGAIKLARKYGHEYLGGREEIITMKKSFHGRTLATITATGQEKFQKGFEPLPEGFSYVPFGDIQALEEAITDRTCAVMLEPVQAEGGVIVPYSGYLRDVRALCDKKNILMILDEVQVGMGRTGKLFAHEHENIAPDMMTLAKALGSGFPVGALLATEKIAAAFTPGSHASTFGGNPLAMSAVKATLRVLLEEGFMEHVTRLGLYMKQRLEKLKENHSCIRDVRGRGLILGMELDMEARSIIDRCIEEGFLVGSAGVHVLRFLPPLVVEKTHVDQLVSALNRILEDA
jgi:predicted acetylornithine/succinylornithine family transaminase